MQNILFWFLAGAVRHNSLTAKATDHSIEAEIKEWLKFAKERDGGRKQRENRKRLERERASTAASGTVVRPDTDSEWIVSFRECCSRCGFQPVDCVVFSLVEYCVFLLYSISWALGCREALWRSIQPITWLRSGWFPQACWAIRFTLYSDGNFFLSLEQFLRRSQVFLPLPRRVQKHEISGLGSPFWRNVMESWNFGAKLLVPRWISGEIWPSFDVKTKAELKFRDPGFRPLKFAGRHLSEEIFFRAPRQKFWMVY